MALRLFEEVGTFEEEYGLRSFGTSAMGTGILLSLRA
jgi:hypothetical protein